MSQAATTAMTNEAGSWRAWPVTRFTGAAALFAVSYALTLFSDVGTGWFLLDKSWFLQVVDRVTSGDVIYRDVFFGATPLSVYLTLPVTRLFGTTFLVAEALWTIWFVALLLVSLRIARQLGWEQGATLLLLLALIVFMVPWLWSPYSLLATLWLLICFSAALSWVSRPQSGATETEAPADRWLVIAGAAAGLCFASKQNLGLYALAALGVAIATAGGGWANRRQWPRLIVLTGGSLLLAIATVLLPMVASGGAAKFLEYGFTNKGTFVRVAGYAFTDGLAEIVRLVRLPPSLATLEPLYWQLLYLLPPIAFVAMGAVWLRSDRGERNRATTVLAFAAAATMGIYPRASLVHLAFTLPVLLLGLGYAVHRLAPGFLAAHGRALRVGTSLLILLGAILILVQPLNIIATGAYEVSNLPHFRGFPVAGSGRPYFRTAEKLSALADDSEPVMILSTRAGFLYLASGLVNPTPFDYPLATAVGQNGEREVIESLERGQFRTVCLDHAFSSTSDLRRLQPHTLLRYVQQNMEARRDLGACAIYRVRR